MRQRNDTHQQPVKYCGRFNKSGSLAMLMATRRALSRRPEHKLKAFTIEMSPTPGPDCLGLISNSDKTGSGQEHDLSYRIMVDAGLTPAGLDHCRSRVPSRYAPRRA